MRVAEIDRNEINGIECISFLLCIPFLKKNIKIHEKKIIDDGWLSSYQPVRVVIFPLFKYVLFVHEYYDDPDKLRLRIQDVFNFDVNELFGMHRIDLILDVEKDSFVAKFKNLTKLYSISFRVQTVNNYGLHSFREQLDELQEDAGAGSYELTYKRSEYQRKKNIFLDSNSDEFNVFLNDSLESDQMDIAVRGADEENNSVYFKASDDLRYEDVPLELTFLDRAQDLITRTVDIFRNWRNIENDD